MLRLLREKGLQTLLSGDTLEERNDGGQALLRLARLGADENAKASEGQDDGTEYEPSSHKRDVAREWGVDPDELMWDFRKNGYVLEEDFIKSLKGDGEVAAIAGADPYYGPVRSAEPREEEKTQPEEENSGREKTKGKDQLRRLNYSILEENSEVNDLSKEELQDILLDYQINIQKFNPYTDPPKKYVVTHGKGDWIPAEKSEVRAAMFPDPYDPVQKFQFMDVRVDPEEGSGLTAEQIDAYLNQNTNAKLFRGHGQDFIDAEKASGINAAFLVASAICEQGELSKGTSSAAPGFFNVYGIGATDGEAQLGGGETARKYGWTSLSYAIKGGAYILRKDWVDAGQATAYDMRWNPSNPTQHWYSTAIIAASERAKYMEGIYSYCLDGDTAGLIFTYDDRYL